LELLCQNKTQTQTIKDIDNPVSLYNYQKQIVLNDSPKQIYNKSRQIGFSFSLALRAYLRGLNGPGFTALYISVAQRLAGEWLDKIRIFLLINNITPVVDKFSEIKLPNGSRFLALPQNPDSARSYSPDEIYLDEFSHYKKDKKMLTALVPALSRRDKQRKLLIGSTPFGKAGEFFKLWDGNNDYDKIKVDIYDAIAQGCPLDLDFCRNSIDEDSFQQEHCCQFVDDISAFFPYELIKACWNEELTNLSLEQLSAIKNPLYAGYDPGKLVDSGVFYVVEKDGDKWITRHIKEWKKINYQVQLQHIEKAFKIARITKLRMDRTGVGEKLYEDLHNAHHSRVEGVSFTNAIKEKMAIDLKVVFEDKQIEIPYNMILTNQLHGLQRLITKSNNARYTHQTGQHDDYVWALALAITNNSNVKTIQARYLGD